MPRTSYIMPLRHKRAISKSQIGHKVTRATRIKMRKTIKGETFAGMKKFQVVPFEWRYVRNFKYDGIEKDIIGNNIKKVVWAYSKAGSCWTGIFDEKIIGFGGMFPVWKGVFQGWALLNKVVANCLRDCIVGMRRKMEEDMVIYNPHRLQIWCLAIPSVMRFIEALGFQKEALLEQYAPNRSDMVMYKIIRGI